MERHPKGRRARGEFKAARENTDDRNGLAVEANGSADDVGPGAELGAPEGVAEDDLMGTIRLIFAVDEVATQRQLDAKHGEKIWSDAGGNGEFWFAASVEDEAVAAVACESLKGLRCSLPIAKIGVRGSHLIGSGILVAGFAEEEEFAGIAIWERAEEGGVDDREDRSVGADA